MMVNGVKSEWVSVLSGIPQGTVLGLLLFSLYITDITDDIDSELSHLADDYVCYHEIKDSEDTVKLQQDIDLLGCWDEISASQLQCNADSRKQIKKVNASSNIHYRAWSSIM